MKQALWCKIYVYCILYIYSEWGIKHSTSGRHHLVFNMMKWQCKQWRSRSTRGFSCFLGVSFNDFSGVQSLSCHILPQNPLPALSNSCVVILYNFPCQIGAIGPPWYIPAMKRWVAEGWRAGAQSTTAQHSGIAPTGRTSRTSRIPSNSIPIFRGFP